MVNNFDALVLCDGDARQNREIAREKVKLVVAKVFHGHAVEAQSHIRR